MTFIYTYLLVLMFSFPFLDPNPSESTTVPKSSTRCLAMMVESHAMWLVMNQEPWLMLCVWAHWVFSPQTPSYITSVLGQDQCLLGYDVPLYPMWISMCPELKINRTCQEQNDENYFVLKFPSLCFYFLLQIQLYQVVSFALRLSFPFKK